jgi:2-methylisocitrate lyase-like PEP mutase family enzyme
MEKAELRRKAERLKALIDAKETLVLPNVWDVAGARVVAEAGFPVIATSSAGIAWSLGYADGEQIARDEMLFMVRRIASSVDLPVTADMEAGYGEAPDAVAATVRASIEAGAVAADSGDAENGRGAGQHRRAVLAHDLHPCPRRLPGDPRQRHLRLDEGRHPPSGDERADGVAPAIRSRLPAGRREAAGRREDGTA